MAIFTYFVFLLLILILTIAQTQKSYGGMPVVVKDVGVVELTKDTVAMILYVTVTNIGHEPIQLTINGKRCCQTITKEDEDCESMELTGGEMGVLFPQDSRNLTLLYVNLYPHNRVGSCEVIIPDDKGRVMEQTIKFNTTLVKGEKSHIPRLLENYYDPSTFTPCDSVDKDTLNSCKPYICDIRYNGFRNYFNYKTERCEPIPKCFADSTKENDLMAYNVETNNCIRLRSTMFQQDFAEFSEGKPSVRTLSHEHGYPINVRCHNGKVDEKGHWCECNEGWSSVPFDNKYFNPDIQVYHMCTVWKGLLTAEEAKNITTLPKSRYKRLNIIIFSFLAVAFLLLLALFGYLLHKLRLAKRVDKADALHQAEMEKLTENIYESE